VSQKGRFRPRVKEAEAVLVPLRPPAVLPAGVCRLLAACLILGAAAAHLAYLAGDCPLDLAPDEAHYWDWSRHLDWSYYSKGPLIAYLIRGGCEIAGPWSLAHTGHLTFAVRLPAVVCGSLLLVSLYLLTRQVHRSEPLALAVVAIALTVPLVAVGSSIMTIDAPYTCCWGWALVLGHRAIFRGSAWAWPALGLVLGLGMLAKYTMIVWLPSAGLFLLTTPAYRRLLWRPGFWCSVLVAGLCCLPILVWNAQHDWVTFRHVFGLSGIADLPRPDGEPSVQWLGPLRYVAEQCVLLLVFWFVTWAAAMWVHRPWREADTGVRYLWWLSAPMFLLFLGLSPKTGSGEMNWPVTAYLSGLVLASAWLARQLQSPVRWYRRATAVNLGLACGAGLLVTVFMHASAWVHPLLARLAGPPRPDNPFPVRRFDPTCRLRGWRALAAEVDRARAELAAEGSEPVLACCSWTLPGELGVYCAGHPQAYSLGLLLGERHSQYDLWPGPLEDGAAFRGRTFLIVGGLHPALEQAFGRVERPHAVPYAEGGGPIAAWTLTVCRDFRGRFPPRRGTHY
jgi:4-amino-4-deoxy-L-arabinose transferase-like glycosyltransferase